MKLLTPHLSTFKSTDMARGKQILEGEGGGRAGTGSDLTDPLLIQFEVERDFLGVGIHVIKMLIYLLDEAMQCNVPYKCWIFEPF